MAKEQRYRRASVPTATKRSKVDTEQGILYGVEIARIGEARGHGVHVDTENLDEIVKLASAQSAGVKARFGHPTMSGEALGTGLGRFHNFRRDARRVIADLHIAGYAAESPEGNLKEYILQRASEDPAGFGASIVFKPGREYQRAADDSKIFVYRYTADGEIDRDEEGYLIRDTRWESGAKTFIEILDLMGADLVDTPAATDGLFHARQSEFNGHAFATRITEFLDDNPDLFEYLSQAEAVEDAFGGFLNKYRAYRAQFHSNMFGKKKDEEQQQQDLELRIAAMEQAMTEGQAAYEAAQAAYETCLQDLTDQLEASKKTESEYAERITALESELQAKDEEIENLQSVPINQVADQEGDAGVPTGDVSNPSELGELPEWEAYEQNHMK